jgi:hypothetical protein
MITIPGQSTAGTDKDTLRECQLLAVSTLRTILARVGRIHCYELQKPGL